MNLKRNEQTMGCHKQVNELKTKRTDNGLSQTQTEDMLFIFINNWRAIKPIAWKELRQSMDRQRKQDMMIMINSERGMGRLTAHAFRWPSIAISKMIFISSAAFHLIPMSVILVLYDKQDRRHDRFICFVWSCSSCSCLASGNCVAHHHPQLP